ncbi:ATP/GTP-binding protein [Streptomyces sp. NPDC096339]|uniref:ATP/GTP-binding protein n=1 Tax=Streptomyces sp. NPDC096339 TaxID=3366086 RepID=UPI003825F24F
MNSAPDPTAAPAVDFVKPEAAPREHADPRTHYARVELVLPLDHLARGEGSYPPVPLEALADALADVRENRGESADIVLDLVPVAPSRVRRRRRRLLAREQLSTGGGPAKPGTPRSTNRFGFDLSSLLSEIATEMKGNQGQDQDQDQSRRRPHTGATLIRRMADWKTARSKLAPGNEPVFSVQLLVRTGAPDADRAQSLLAHVLAALKPWSGDERLLPVGLPRGITRVRDRMHQRRFDRRFESGVFTPRRDSWCTAPQIAGLLKPPAPNDGAAHVSRSGGEVPPPPAALPTWTGQHDLLPLGWVARPGEGERLVGVPLKYLHLGLFLGKSGSGKTEMSLVQAIALAHNGCGVLLLDPHGDGWARARPYLAHQAMADRIWEIDLTSAEPDTTVASWNPLSMENRIESEIPDIVQSVVTGFAAPLNWSDSAGRVKTVLTRAVESLVSLSWQVCRAGRPELAPTVFQIRTILTDAAWRTAVLPYLPKETRDFWTNAFPTYTKDAVPVVTAAIDQLSSSNAIKAFLGAARSTYDVRHAMDTSKIVFVCPSGTGDADRVISSLLIYDLFRAGLSRRDTPAELRRPFYSFIDELAHVDSASKGTLAQITEQLRKFNVKLLARTRTAQHLSPTARQGLLQDPSILSTAASDVEEAALVTHRWDKKVSPETITGLDRHDYVMSVTLDGGTTDPFRVRGASIEELYADYHRPRNEELLRRAIDENLERRPVRDILTDLRLLDPRLRQFVPALAAQPDDDVLVGSGSPPIISGTRTASSAAVTLGKVLPLDPNRPRRR